MEFIPARRKPESPWSPPPPAELRWVRSVWNRRPRRGFVMGLSLGVLIYSVLVLLLVAWMGDIGIRCVFGTDLKDSVPSDYTWTPAPPRLGDTLLAIGGTELKNYTDYVRVMRGLSKRVKQTVEVRWWDHVERKEKRATALGSVSAAAQRVLLVARMVSPGDGDLRDRRPGLLEAPAG